MGHGDRWWGHVTSLGRDSATERLPGTESHRKSAQYVAAELEKAGVLAQEDPDPQWDVSIRSDQPSLIRRGVPAVAFKVGHEKDGANQAADKSRASLFNGLVLELAMTVANRAERPQWLATSYFKRFSR